jgi:hypothetical protein
LFAFHHLPTVSQPEIDAPDEGAGSHALRRFATALVGALLLASLSCAGSVPRFAPCTNADTCPSGTTCESATTQIQQGTVTTPTFCTWSCSGDDAVSSQGCPSGGVCVGAFGSDVVGQLDDYGFCFEDCSAGQTCPDGEGCSVAQLIDGGMTMVCVPIPSDPLSGTSWTSSTLIEPAMQVGVTTSSYTMRFAAANTGVAAFASGPFTATFVQTYDASAPMYAGCTETTTFTGGQWVDIPPAGTKNGDINVTNAMGSTARSGCTSASDNATGVMGIYDDAVDYMNGAPYQIMGTTLTLNGTGGVVPYGNDAMWTFTPSM